MIRSIPVALLLVAALAEPASSQGDEWRPPGRQMPTMPTLAELEGNWLGSRAGWFADLQAVTGVAPAELRAWGEPRGGPVARLVRYQRGPLPIAIWSDRNGDRSADAVEIYRSGALVAQLLDSDYDGDANVLRRYDASGALISEERF